MVNSAKMGGADRLAEETVCELITDLIGVPGVCITHPYFSIVGVAVETIIERCPLFRGLKLSFIVGIQSP